MEQTIKGHHLTETFWSVGEFADASVKGATQVIRQQEGHFTDLPYHAESVEMLRHGWQDELAETLEVAESAVSLASQEHMVDTFAPQWDVTGAEVDVARYLSGEPECMIDFPLSKTSKSGKVVTLVASICYSGVVRTESINKRGRVMAALALALAQLGHATEIWVDISLGDSSGASAYQRICVKGVNDELDPAVLMFALAHPAMLRRVAFGSWDGWKGEWKQAFSVKSGRGYPDRRTDADVNLYPEGTIFLPEMGPSRDVPNADEFLREHLGNLGLLAE